MNLKITVNKNWLCYQAFHFQLCIFEKSKKIFVKEYHSGKENAKNHFYAECIKFFEKNKIVVDKDNLKKELSEKINKAAIRNEKIVEKQIKEKVEKYIFNNFTKKKIDDAIEKYGVFAEKIGEGSWKLKDKYVEPNSLFYFENAKKSYIIQLKNICEKKHIEIPLTSKLQIYDEFWDKFEYKEEFNIVKIKEENIKKTLFFLWPYPP